MYIHDVGIYMLLPPIGYTDNRLPLPRNFFDNKDYSVKRVLDYITINRLNSMPRYPYLMMELYNLHYYAKLINLKLIMKNETQ